MIELNLGELGIVKVPDPKETATLTAKGLEDAGWWNKLSDAIASALVKALFAVVKETARIYDLLLAVILKFYAAGQGEGNQSFWLLVAAIMEDLTGVEVDAQALVQAAKKRGRLGGMESVGGSLFDLLESEFATNGQITPGSGVKAAKTHLGFVSSFAARQGNIALVSEVLSFKHAEEVREFGEMLAKGLGLGRMTRMALMPLFKTLVANPLQADLNAKYRPTKLSEALFVSAFNQGLIDEPTLTAELVHLGYSDKYIEIIKDTNQRKVSEAEIIKLFQRGKYDRAQALAKFKALAVTEETANIIIDAAEPSLPDADAFRLFLAGRLEEQSVYANLGLKGNTPETSKQIIDSRRLAAADGEMRSFVTQLVDLAKNHDIDLEAFKSELQSTTLTEEEQKWITRRIGIFLEQPQKYASLAQMEGFFSDGLIDLDDFRTWLEREGYGLDDRQRFVQALFLKMDKAKQPKPKKKLSLSELRKAYKGSEITIDQFKSGAAALGYADDSIEIFLAEIPGA